MSRKSYSLFIASVAVLILSCVNAQSSRPFLSVNQFQENCEGDIINIGYGTYAESCLTNNVYSIYMYPYEGNKIVNVSHHWNSYCADWYNTDMFKVSECEVVDQDQYFYLSWLKTPQEAKIPENAYIIQGFDSDCQKVLNYWYAVNGSTINGHPDSTSTLTYICSNNEPYINTCVPGQSCSLDNMSQSCTSEKPISIQCT